MRIVVLGCGGIGGVIAACLTRSGADVTPVTGNSAIASALRSDGFHVQDFAGEGWSIMPVRAPRVTPADGDGGERFDLCIAATQSTTLAAALTEIRPYLAPGAKVVCCQNGLPEERAAQVLGRESILGCVVGWGASMIAPGRYRRTSASTGQLLLGRPFAESPDPEGLLPMFTPTLPAAVALELAPVRWSKLAINCVTSTIGAVGGDRLGALLRHRFVRRIALEVFAEVAAVARKGGVHPAPLAGMLDIEKIAITAAERQLRLGSPGLAYKHSVLLAVGFKYRRMRSSMLYALERGRPPEIDFLNGEIVGRGQALGVPTPVNLALCAAVRELAQAPGPPASPRLARLRRLYDETIAPIETAAAA